MANQNAFIGRSDQPTSEQVGEALGTSAEAWRQLVARAAEEQGVTEQEWKSSSVKHGWSLRLLRKKRVIVYLNPCENCFLVSFALGDKAVRAAKEVDLPKTVLKAIEEAPRYAEGTAVRLAVNGPKDLAAIHKLIAIKLAN